MKTTTPDNPSDSRSSNQPEETARRRWIETSLVVGFWVCIFMFTLGKEVIDPRGHGPDGLTSGQALATGFEYAAWLLLTPGIFWLSSRFSLDREKWIPYLLLHLSIALLIGVAMDALGFLLRSVFIFNDGPSFSLAEGVLNLFFVDEFIIYVIVLTAGFARAYFHRYRQRQQEAAQLRTQAAQLEAELSDARLQALRMQINPHFLFNTLHAVSTLVERNPQGVQRMIARLSQLLRYTLDNSNQEVPLKEELEFLRDYLEIQRIRFEDHLEINLDVASDVHEALVPSLILQPLVENAIKHGTSKAEGTGRVEIRARRTDKDLILSVRDNGPGFGAPSSNGQKMFSQGVGLSNTRERLENLYGKAQSLTLQAAEEGGLVAQITLPYHTSADLRATAFSSDG